MNQVYKKGKDHPLWKIGDRGGYDRVNVDGRRTHGHWLVIENVLGRAFPPGAVTHHVDENKKNNSNNNLVLCENRAYHNFLHERLRAYKATGHANWKRCPYCKGYDAPENMHHRKDRDKYRHVECHKEYMKAYKERMRAA